MDKTGNIKKGTSMHEVLYLIYINHPSDVSTLWVRLARQIIQTSFDAVLSSLASHGYIQRTRKRIALTQKGVEFCQVEFVKPSSENSNALDPSPTG